MDTYPNSPGFKEGTTSREAAEALVASGRYATVFDAVHAWFKAGNTGTADECAVAIHEEPLTVRPRVSELHSAGFIEPTGERRKSLAGGRSSHVWRRVS